MGEQVQTTGTAAPNALGPVERVVDWFRHSRVGEAAAISLAALVTITGCSNHETRFDKANADTPAATAGGEALPGTVKDGSDAAIMADVMSDLTNCGGIKGELWTEKPYSPNHMFDYYDANPDMVDASQRFWTNIMGSDALSFLVDKAVANKDAASNKQIAGNNLMTAFTQKHIASRDVPEGTIERNHNCVDTNGDGQADTIKFLDLRVAHHGNTSQEGEKRTTLSGLVLHVSDFNEFVSKMQAAGKDPNQLITFPISVDINGDKQIEGNERFVFVATNSAICENIELRGQLPQKPKTTPVTSPPSGATTTTGPSERSTTTTVPTGTTVPNKVPVLPVEGSQSSGPGAGGSPGPEGTTSTTAKPNTTTTAGSPDSPTTSPWPSTTEAPIPAPTSTPTTAPDGPPPTNVP